MEWSGFEWVGVNGVELKDRSLSLNLKMSHTINLNQNLNVNLNLNQTLPMATSAPGPRDDPPLTLVVKLLLLPLPLTPGAVRNGPPLVCFTVPSILTHDEKPIEVHSSYGKSKGI